MEHEVRAVAAAAERLGSEFVKAVELIRDNQSKLVLCGMGKSGHIARKLAATFSSCGVPAVFLHAGEATHGDLGVYQAGDPTIVFSKSGSTAEVVRLMPVLRRFNSPVIAIVGQLNSEIADAADVVLDARVEREADPLGLMPTASSTVMLALGDALASAVAQGRGFTREEFAIFHPGGQLGRNLLISVGEVMQPLNRVAVVEPKTEMREVVIAMTHSPYGAACVVEADGRLRGILTDGDIRRLLVSRPEVLTLSAGECMTAHPISISPKSLIGEAIRTMEERPSQISVLPVVDGAEQRLVGLLRIHDAYQPQNP